MARLGIFFPLDCFDEEVLQGMSDSQRLDCARHSEAYYGESCPTYPEAEITDSIKDAYSETHILLYVEDE